MRNKITCFIVLCCSLYGCDKLEVKSVDFEVSVDKNMYKLGDTVRFDLRGEPDYLLFYSGEKGARYEFRDRVITEKGNPLLSFTSLKTGATAAKIQVLVSTDFNGIYDKNAVSAAQWDDLSPLAVFSTGADNTPSGNITLQHYKENKRPIYLAFRSYKPDDGITQNYNHTIRTLNIKLDGVDGSSYDINPGINLQGWKNVSWALESTPWVVNSSNQLVLNNAAPTGVHEEWAISSAIRLDHVVPDRPKSLKSMAMVMPRQLEHVFKERGVYKVTFVATNQSAEDKKEVVKELDITID
ncbi:MAG: DUF5017 domain-containing protein [Sphingobacterium sp.]|jgi:hypothetical protein|nr:DUF5017 domain-containing protein [Sphingobacterium sp.]